VHRTIRLWARDFYRAPVVGKGWAACVSYNAEKSLAHNLMVNSLCEMCLRESCLLYSSWNGYLFWWLQLLWFPAGGKWPLSYEGHWMVPFNLKVLVCNCSHARIRAKTICRVAEALFASWKQNWRWKQCFSRFAKLGNVGEICKRYECFRKHSFWKHASSFYWHWRTQQFFAKGTRKGLR